MGLRIGLFQFNCGQGQAGNREAILRGVSQAAAAGVRLLVTPECALSGYPPVEIPSVDAIDFDAQDAFEGELCALCARHDLYLAVGSVRRTADGCANTLTLLGPQGRVGHYDKRALWGWDTENFRPGTQEGIFEIDGVRFGLRICFEVRFPEYFRELFGQNIGLCIVSFCDVSAQPSPRRYDTIRAHLLTRAVENVMTVLSVDSISAYQTAPTGVFDPDGHLLQEAPPNEEALLIYDYQPAAPDFGRQGRLSVSRALQRR
ncbi:MAG: carbon-nitrogen hydrolase family protein [Eubacteriales bacterium]|nr:carbon-nitrogen hydrolase family protein [Eubacteriales bacterium]